MKRLGKVLEFWFGTTQDDAQVAGEKNALWFGKNTETDRRIEEQFGGLVRDAAAGAFINRIRTPRERLAVVLLLDQFSRNIYRGRGESFANDPLALELALEGLEQGEDRHLRPIERVFLYLPLEHSEELVMQNRSVELFSALLKDVPEGWRTNFSGYLDYAVRHRDIIIRFGRFPHRNALLGRTSTPAEREFLSRPGSSF